MDRASLKSSIKPPVLTQGMTWKEWSQRFRAYIGIIDADMVRILAQAEATPTPIVVDGELQERDLVLYHLLGMDEVPLKRSRQVYILELLLLDEECGRCIAIRRPRGRLWRRLLRSLSRSRLGWSRSTRNSKKNNNIVANSDQNYDVLQYVVQALIQSLASPARSRAG